MSQLLVKEVEQRKLHLSPRNASLSSLALAVVRAVGVQTGQTLLAATRFSFNRDNPCAL